MERWGCATLVMVVLAFSTLKAAPQWSYSASQRAAGAVGREVVLGVACASAGPVISIRFRDDSRFGTGLVVASFDTGTTLDVEFANRGSQLNAVANNRAGRNFIRLLRSANTVTLAVGKGDSPIADAVGLRGSSAAIGRLPCM